MKPLLTFYESVYRVEGMTCQACADSIESAISVLPDVSFASVSLLDKGTTMFQTKPGPYDMWAIQYGYEQFNDNNLLKNLEHFFRKFRQFFRKMGSP